MIRERRLVARWNINYQTQVAFGASKDFVACQIKDINFKGVQLVVAQNLEKDAFKKMTLMLSMDAALEIEFWLAWVKKTGNQHTYGLYFTKISDGDKEKIYKFVYHNYHQEMSKEWWKGLVKKGIAMENSGSQDRRIFERMPANLGLRYLAPGQAVECKGMTCDISAKGIGFVSDHNLGLNTDLEFWLDQQDHKGVLYTRGKVAWSRPQGVRQFRIGVNLEKADLMGLSRVIRTV